MFTFVYLLFLENWLYIHPSCFLLISKFNLSIYLTRFREVFYNTDLHIICIYFSEYFTNNNSEFVIHQDNQSNLWKPLKIWCFPPESCFTKRQKFWAKIKMHNRGLGVVGVLSWIIFLKQMCTSVALICISTWLIIILIEIV